MATTYTRKSTERQVKRTASKAKKKLGTGAFVLLAVTLVVSIALGAALAHYVTRGDTFRLHSTETILLEAGQSYSYSDLLTDYDAVSLGRDVSASVTVTPSFEVASDGTVTLDAGTYYITYTMPVFFDLKQVDRIATIRVQEAEDASAVQGGGVNNG
jgi:hypothetical protein